MVKRSTRPARPSAAQPEPAPGSAMTEAAPAPAAPVADPEPALEPAAAAVAATAEPAATADSPAAGATAGAWPDVSSPPLGPHCPWCSTPLPSADLATCPNCGAQLNSAADGDVPGVTTIDVAALAWKAGAPPRRGRILSWISGEDDTPVDSSGASPTAVEPPSLAVRREMLRLELEAEGISLPHDAEPSGAEEAAAAAEAAAAEPGAGASPAAGGPTATSGA
jgi:hypothetical protein